MKRKNSDKRQVSLAKKPKLDDVFPIDTFLQNPGLKHIAEEILAYLDIKTLVRCRSVSKSMTQVIDGCRRLQKKILRKLILNVKTSEFTELRKAYEAHKRQQLRWSRYPPRYPAIPFFTAQQFQCLMVVLDSDLTMKELRIILKHVQLYQSLPPDFLIHKTGFGKFRFARKNLVDFALLEKNIDFIKLLGNRSKFDFSVKSWCFNTTLLHHACMISNSDMVDYLLEISKESDLNAEDNTFCERTPLDWATINGDLAIIRSLLDHTGTGIKLSPRCLGIAIANHHDIEIVKLILKKADELGIDVDTNRHPPFYVACQFGNVKVAELLLERPNVSVDTHRIIHFDGEELHTTPLQIACIMGQAEIVKLILQCSSSRNINLNETCVCGHTPLHYASMYGRDDVVEILLDHAESHNIIIDIKNKYDRTFDEEAMPTRLMPRSLERGKTQVAMQDCVTFDYRSDLGPFKKHWPMNFRMND